MDEARESFPFVRDVSLLGLRAVGAENLGILLGGAGEGEGERIWRGELGRLRPRGEEGRLRARFIALSSSTLLQKNISWTFCILLNIFSCCRNCLSYLEICWSGFPSHLHLEVRRGPCLKYASKYPLGSLSAFGTSYKTSTGDIRKGKLSNETNCVNMNKFQLCQSVSVCSQ